jgi:5-dehydro-2-deoxygluconokinase
MAVKPARARTERRTKDSKPRSAKARTADQIRTPLHRQRSFIRYVGGFAGNVATGLARLEVKTAVVSRVGNDGHGEFIRNFLAQEGVDVRWLSTNGTLNTPVVFCEIWPPDRFPLLFYRTPTAPDWELTTSDFDLDEVAQARILLATGTALARERSRQAHFAVLEQHRGTAIFDLDFRPMFWSNPDQFREHVTTALRHSDVVVGNEEEVAAASGEADPRRGVEALQTLGPRMVVLKRGGKGAALYERGRTIEVPPVPGNVVNGLGAGDAFAAALVHGLLRGLDLEQTLRRANHAGAIVAGQIPCSEAMPRLPDLEATIP